MKPWTRKIWFAKPVLAGLCGAALLATAAAAQTAMAPSSLPLYFEANRGQADSSAQFVARGRNSEFLISPDAAQFVLRKTTGAGAFSAQMVRMQFVGASSRAQISGAEELPGKVNYLIGNEPARWQTGVATFAKVRVGEIYPGVNLAYYGNQRHLEYDFTVAPGADPGIIAIRFDGADKISISPAGELVLNLGDGEIRQPKPVIYQAANGARREISGGYKILDAQTVAFAVGDYDHGLPLVIDPVMQPVLSYSTYLGGNANDTAATVAVDTNGFVYIAGETLSTKLATVGSFQTNFGGGTVNGDAFVAKFNYDGTNVSLVYCTYLGGSQDDLASSLAVDMAGNVFLTGYTDSPDFPTTNALYSKILGHAYKNIHGSTFYSGNAFVAELNTNGSKLVYSTYLGGSGVGTYIGQDEGMGIALDSAGNAYVAGYTGSTNFPVVNPLTCQLAGTTNTLLNRLAGSYNGFLAKIGPGGTNLLYSTYFGGTNIDVATGIAVDSAGAVYLAGYTDSTNFPTTNAVQPYLGGVTNAVLSFDAFAAKFVQPSATNIVLVYSTYLGGANDDFGYGVAADPAGDAFVTGSTASPNFPNTATAVPGLFNELTNNLNGSLLTTNAFLAKLGPDGTSLVYSAVFGGFVCDTGYGVAVDPTTGNAFVVGTTSSTNFPTLNATNYFAMTNSGGDDAFVTAFSADGSALLYSVYLGGANNDFGYGIAVDAYGSAYIVGQTLSANFPATNMIATNALHTALNGTSDAFLAKIFNDPPSLFLTGNNSHVQVGVNANAKLEPELPRLFRLECSTNLFSTNWVRVLQPLAATNNHFAVTLDRTNKAMFFRLHQF
jgi:hypothetical protein